MAKLDEFGHPPVTSGSHVGCYAIELTLRRQRKRLEEVIEGLLLYLNDSPAQTIVPDGRITDAADALAEEGGTDDQGHGHSLACVPGCRLQEGELKPEVERRLRESLKTPREELLTSDEMREQLDDREPEDADDSHN